MRSCLLVGGAPTEHHGLDFIIEHCHFDAVFAVDAGYEALKERAIVAQGVFGDFDSLGYVPSHDQLAIQGFEAVGEQGAQLEVFDTHKDFTDMDWAISHAIEQGYDNIVLCDSLHARLDHTLGNLQLMARSAQAGQRVWGITEEEIVLTLDAEGGLAELFVDAGAWGTCSVISHSDEATGLMEEGMEYGLQDAQVTNRALWGISNELVGTPAHISLDSGSVWVFLPLKEVERVTYAGMKLV